MSSDQKIEPGALRQLAVKAIVPQLEGMSGEAIADLRAAEELDGNPRVSLLHAITAVQTERAAAAPVVDAAAPVVDAPAWLTPDYLGPLTADQGQARLRVHGHHVTKPVSAPVEK